MKKLPEEKLKKNRVVPVRIPNKEINDLLIKGANLDHTSNGKLGTFMRNASIDKAKKLLREQKKGEGCA